jgi:hypothetical protein
LLFINSLPQKSIKLFGWDLSEFIEGRHELLHLYFVLVDMIQATFCDKNNLEEASSLARMIQALNPKLLNKKGKEEFYSFKAVYKDIYISILSEFLRNFLGVENFNSDCTPVLINNMTNNEERQTAFKQMFRSFIIKSHSDFETCSQEDDGSKKLPLFYPHQDHVRGRPMEKKKLGEAETLPKRN